MEPPETIDRLYRRKVASSFPAAITAADSLHPRQEAPLSDQCLQGLCRSLRCYEAAGQWPEELRDLVVRMIPKESSGVRTILIFRALHRVWSRARGDVAKRWAEIALSDPF